VPTRIQLLTDLSTALIITRKVSMLPPALSLTTNYYFSFVMGAVWLATLFYIFKELYHLITLQIYNGFFNCANI